MNRFPFGSYTQIYAPEVNCTHNAMQLPLMNACPWWMQKKSRGIIICENNNRIAKWGLLSTLISFLYRFRTVQEHTLSKLIDADFH